MSRHDQKVTLHQIADQARHAQELCAQNDLPEIVTDWQKRAAFERVMEVLRRGRETAAAGPVRTLSRRAMEAPRRDARSRQPWLRCDRLRDSVGHGAR